MRALVYYIATSIDGYIAAADGSFDAFPMEGDHFAHLIAEYPETFPTHVHPHFGIDVPDGRFGTVVMGRATYQPALDAGITSPYAHLRQYVFSRTLDLSDGSPIVTDADPLETVQVLKAGAGKDIWLCGGGSLASALASEIDELIVKRNPIVLGQGIPMFGAADALPSFTVADNRVFESGVIITRYVRN